MLVNFNMIFNEVQPARRTRLREAGAQNTVRALALASICDVEIREKGLKLLAIFGLTVY